MSRYDNDDAVVALLRESVPPVPEMADRVTAIRAKAGRQRTMLWTQALGAVASVLLVVGVAAAVGTAGGRREAGPVAPIDDPLAAGIKAFDTVKSLRFEASSTPTGNPSVPGGQISDEQLKAMLTARITGAAERDGDLQVDGDLSPVMLFGVEEPGEFEVHFRVVDGQSYRSVMPGEDAPKGKTWIAEEGATQTSSRDLTRWLRLGAAFAEDVTYTGPGVVRDEPVAEYRFTVPKRVARFADVVVTFALDGENRLRRVATEIPWTGIFVMMSGDTEGMEGADDSTVRVELLVYGYDEPVTVRKPPADKTATAEQMRAIEDAQRDEMTRCLDAAGADHEAADKCFAAHRSSADGCTTETQPDGSRTTSCSKGTYGEVVVDGSAGPDSGWTEYPPGTVVTLQPSPMP